MPSNSSPALHGSVERKQELWEKHRAFHERNDD